MRKRIIIRCSEQEKAEFLAAAKRAGYTSFISRFCDVALYPAHTQSLDIFVEGFEQYEDIELFTESLSLRQRRRGLALFETPLN